MKDFSDRCKQRKRGRHAVAGGGRGIERGMQARASETEEREVCCSRCRQSDGARHEILSAQARQQQGRQCQRARRAS